MSVIKLTHNIENDKYTDYIYNAFDIQNTEQSIVEIPYDLSEGKTFDWNIGLIYGPSGCGKSTILNRLGDQKQIEFSHTKSLISNFDFLEPNEAARLLSSMGLSTVPSWLRPYHTLSNGEQYRAKLAHLVGSSEDGDTILVDEFTSVVDRTVAKTMSYALQKYIRKHNKRIVLASCHYDILEWLTPDWTYSPLENEGKLKRYEKKNQDLKSPFKLVEQKHILGTSSKNIII